MSFWSTNNIDRSSHARSSLDPFIGKGYEDAKAPVEIPLRPGVNSNGWDPKLTNLVCSIAKCYFNKAACISIA